MYAHDTGQVIGRILYALGSDLCAEMIREENIYILRNCANKKFGIMLFDLNYNWIGLEGILVTVFICTILEFQNIPLLNYKHLKLYENHIFQSI